MRSKAYRAIGEMIRKHRRAKKLTQSDLGELLGYGSPQFIHLFERGFSKVPLDVLGTLVVVLDLPEQQIMKLLMDERLEDLKNELQAGKKANFAMNRISRKGAA